MMFVTTWGREFIELCRSMRGQLQESPWHQELARCCVDTDAAHRAYNAGEYLYEPTGGGSVGLRTFMARPSFRRVTCAQNGQNPWSLSTS